MLKHRANVGFTLIEVMITVVIIGILATIAVPSYQNYILKAETAELIERIDAMRTKMGVQAATGDTQMRQEFSRALSEFPDYLDAYGLKGDFSSPYPGIVAFYHVIDHDFSDIRGAKGMRPYLGLYATSPQALKFLRALEESLPSGIYTWGLSDKVMMVSLLDHGAQVTSTNPPNNMIPTRVTTPPQVNSPQPQTTNNLQPPTTVINQPSVATTSSQTSNTPSQNMHSQPSTHLQPTQPSHPDQPSVSEHHHSNNGNHGNHQNNGHQGGHGKH